MPENNTERTFLNATWWKLLNAPICVAIVSLFAVGFGIIPWLWEHSIAPNLQNASERFAISEEVTQRIIWSKKWQHEDANKSLLILNGADSQFISHPKYARRSLSSLLAELRSLGYDWQGASYPAVISLAQRVGTSDLPELFQLLEVPFPQGTEFDGTGTLVDDPTINVIGAVIVIIVFPIVQLMLWYRAVGVRVRSWPLLVTYAVIGILLIDVAFFWIYPAVFGEPFWNLGLRLLFCIVILGVCFFVWYVLGVIIERVWPAQSP